MFLVLLKFSKNKAAATAFMQMHNEWLQRGFSDGVFVLAGSYEPNLGGAILAYGLPRAALQARIDSDPFVAEGVVTAEIIEITAVKTHQQLNFLLPNSDVG